MSYRDLEARIEVLTTERDRLLAQPTIDVVATHRAARKPSVAAWWRGEKA